MAARKKGKRTPADNKGLIYAEKRPREYAMEIIKSVPEEVNRLLDEANCPDELKPMAKTHVYNGLARAWSRQKR